MLIHFTYKSNAFRAQSYQKSFNIIANNNALIIILNYTSYRAYSRGDLRYNFY